MASQTQALRLQKVERSVSALPSRNKYDLSQLTVPELRVLKRYVQGECSVDDLRILENSIYPKLVAEGGKRRAQFS